MSSFPLLAQFWLSWDTFWSCLWPIALLAGTALLLGLWGAFLLFGNRFRVLREARETNTRLVNRLNSIVDDQNVLVENLNNRFSVEQKKLNLQIANRDSKLKDLTTRLAKHEETAANHKSVVAGRDANINSLQADLSDRDKQIILLKRKIDNEGHLLKRIAQLEALLNDRENEIANMHGDLEEHRLTIGTRDKRIEELLANQNDGTADARIAELEPALAELEAALAGREDDLNDAKGLYDDLEKTYNDLEKTLTERDEELEDVRKELEDIRKQRDDLDKDLNELLAERENDNSSANDEKIIELEKIIDDRDTELLSIREGLEGRIQELESLLGQRESTIIALQSDLQANDGLHDQQARLRELDQEIANLKNDLSSQTGLHDRIHELEAALHSREEDLQKFHEQNADHHSAFQDLESKLNEAQRERDEEIEKLSDLLRNRDEELNSLHGQSSANDSLQIKVGELESMLGERDSELANLKTASTEASRRIEELEQLIKEREEKIKNLYQEADSISSQLQENNQFSEQIHDLEWSLGEKDGEIDGLKHEKDGYVSRVRELEWLLGEKDGELDCLREEKSLLNEKIHLHEEMNAQIGYLERSIREKEGEVERWWTECEGLKSQLTSRDTEIDHLRRDVEITNGLESKIEELEWLLGEKDTELEKLRLELRPRPQRPQRAQSTSLETRVRELELQVYDRDRELMSLRQREPKGTSGGSSLRVIGVATESTSDIQARIRELEAILERRTSTHYKSSSDRPDEYRFTLEDGSTIYVKGNELIDYDGKTHVASELFESLQDND